MNEQEKYDWMVYVSCMTFNHAPYIVDAMNGFTMQNTDFPFVCAIVDDASTDGEQEVIKNYLNEHFDLEDKVVARHEETDDYVLTFARHKTNLNCYFAVFFLKYNHYSKKKPKASYLAQWRDKANYIAICEGDDYWTDGTKLKKQVEFLEKHPEFIFCVHNFKRYIESEGKYEEGYRIKQDCIIDKKIYFKYWLTQPLTSVIRATAIPCNETRKSYKHYRDNHLFYLLLQKGLGYYMADVMGVYRISNKGLWTSLNKIGKVKIDLICFMELLKYHKDDVYLRKNCVGLYSCYIFSSMNENTPIEKIDTSLFRLQDKIMVGLRIAYFYCRWFFSHKK